MVSLHLSAAGEGTLFREIYYACSTVEWTDWRQSRVLQGPTVQLTIGLTCTRETPTSVPTAAYLSTGFIRSGSALPMGTHHEGCVRSNRAIAESASRRPRPARRRRTPSLRCDRA